MDVIFDDITVFKDIIQRGICGGKSCFCIYLSLNWGFFMFVWIALIPVGYFWLFVINDIIYWILKNWIIKMIEHNINRESKIKQLLNWFMLSVLHWSFIDCLTLSGHETNNFTISKKFTLTRRCKNTFFCQLEPNNSVSLKVFVGFFHRHENFMKVLDVKMFLSVYCNGDFSFPINVT